MAWIYRLAGALRALVLRDRLDRDVDDELRSFVDASVEHHTQRGLSREEAVRAARREMGSEASVKQAVRESGWETHVDAVWRDLVYAVRSFSRAPMFTIVAVLTLGLGVGANTAIFSVVHGVLLKPLPYADSDRIVRLYMNMPASESPSKRPLRAARGLTAHQIDEVRREGASVLACRHCVSHAARFAVDRGGRAPAGRGRVGECVRDDRREAGARQSVYDSG